MKTIAVLVLMFSSFCALSQDWRDTLKMARTAYSLKDYDKAIGFYKKAQKGAPDNVDLSDEMAQSAYKSGQYETAEKIYQQSQGSKKTSKSRANNLHNMGNSRMKSKNYQGAIDAYKDALRINPNDEKTRYNLSEAMRKLKREKDKQDQNQNGQNGNQGDQGDSGGDSNPQDGDPGNDSAQGSKNQQKGQNKSSNNGKKPKNGSGTPQNNKGQLSNKSAERILDDLLRKEAETKQRMAGNRGGGSKSKSGKDW